MPSLPGREIMVEQLEPVDPQKKDFSTKFILD
jgi:hypothetical protein